MPVQDTFEKNLKCSICGLSEIDTLNYGEIHAVKELEVHLFCLYFSTFLPQRGTDNAGICGFEIRDIKHLIKTTTKTQCCYCNKGSATTYCQFPKCKRVFHQICGFKSNARFEYLENFLSFCHLHNEIKDEDIDFPVINGCWICYEQLEEYNPVTTVPSCCGKWFHQQCLRTYAIHAGYAFLCPLCRNKNYGDFARRHGIYVPEYEALWEKTHDYADIERYYTHCDATQCVCPEGRDFSKNKWTIDVCSCCGSYGLHTRCRPQIERNDKVTCDTCLKIVQARQARQNQNLRANNQVTPDEKVLQNSNNIKLEDHVDMVDLTQDEDEEQNIQSLGVDEPLQEKGRAENVLQFSNNMKLEDDVEIVDLTQRDDEQVDVFEQNIRSHVEESLEEKRKREKAERPKRDEMRRFRLHLLFRDYKPGESSDAE